MSTNGTNGHQPGTHGRDPLRADEWLEARHAATSERTSPFARGRNTQPPPPPAPPVEDHDPTSLPLFASAWTSGQEPPGCARSDFSLRPLVAPAPEEPHDSRGTADKVELDWELMAQYRAEISSRLTARLDKEGGRVTEEDREQMGLDVIEEFIKSEAETLVSTGRPAWTKNQEKAFKTALHAALFGLGRLQPLVDRADVENIIVMARGPICSVWLELVDGTLVEADPDRRLRGRAARVPRRPRRPTEPALHRGPPPPGPPATRGSAARSRLLGDGLHLGCYPTTRYARGVDGRDGLPPQGLQRGPGRLHGRLRQGR